MCVQFGWENESASGGTLGPHLAAPHFAHEHDVPAGFLADGVEAANARLWGEKRISTC